MSEGRALLACLDRLHARAGHGVFAFDLDGTCTHWSAGMQEITDVLSGVGQSVLTLFNGLFAGADFGVGVSRSADAMPFQIRQTGRRGFCDFTATPLISDGVVGGTVCVMQDVTERVTLRDQMAEIETRFRNMADASPVLLWMSGSDALCTFFNRTWLEFTGRSLEEEIGVGWAEGVHFQDLQRCMDNYLAAFRERAQFAMEYRLRRHDGEYRWVLDQGTPRYSPDGTFAGFIGSCIDVTDRRRVEEDLHQTIRGRDEFISIAAHELRTPLMPMRLAVDLLARVSDGQSPELKSKVDMLDRAITRQTEMIEALLDASRIDAGMAIELAAADLNEIVRTVIARFERTELRLEVAAPVMGAWDRGKLDQVVSNLISNGLKYGEGRPVEIIVDAQGRRSARIVVRDHGIGIAAQDQSRIFGRFERAVAVQNYSGFGLGLWITKSLVDAMGGVIQLESSIGNGSTFTVELPIRGLDA